jgi:hypothetical protein
MPDDFNPSKGTALLIPSGTINDPSKQHLFFLITNPCPAGHHLAVSISRVKDGRVADRTCVLAAGDHPFVQADSFVMYGLARQLPGPGIIKCVISKLYTLKENCSPELIQRVCDGIPESPFTPRWAKKYFADNSNR